MSWEVLVYVLGSPFYFEKRSGSGTNDTSPVLGIVETEGDFLVKEIGSSLSRKELVKSFIRVVGSRLDQAIGERKGGRGQEPLEVQPTNMVGQVEAPS